MARTTGKPLLRENLETSTTKEKNKESNDPSKGRVNLTKRRVELGLPKRKDAKGPEAVYDALRFPQIAYTLSKEYGFTQSQLAQVFGVKLNTVEFWSIKHKEFKEMLKKGRDEYDGENVENALLKKCLGYTFEEKSIKRIKLTGKIDDKVTVQVPATEIITTTKHMSPDTKAIMFWLQNRNSERWKNMTYIKGEIESHSSHVELTGDISNMSSDDIRVLRDIIVAQQQKQLPAECQNIQEYDLSDMIEKARDIKLIEDAIIVP